MRYALVLSVLLIAPLTTSAEDPNEEARSAIIHAMLAAACPTNDDKRSIQLAQLLLDAEGYAAVSAQEAFDSATEQAKTSQQRPEAIACTLIDRVEGDHPFAAEVAD